jgi:hypothetical protein
VSPRVIVATVAVTAVLGCGGLLWASESPQLPTAFSVNVPAATLMPPLAAGREACQAPIRVSSPAGAVRAWVWPDFRPSPPLAVTVRDLATRAVLATGSMSSVPARRSAPAGDIVALYPTPVSRTAVLTRSLPAGQEILVCMRAQGPGTATFMGSRPTALSGQFKVPGKATTAGAMSLLFLAPHTRSLLSLLPTAFRRAALFRPTWVGAWTFWLLGIGLLLGFGLAAWAVVLAGRADGDADAGGGDAGPSRSPRASA